MEFKKMFDMVAEKKAALAEAEKASILLDVLNAEAALAEALHAVVAAEDMEQALNTVKECKSNVTALKASIEFADAEAALADAEAALADAEAALKHSLNGASQYDITLYLVTAEGYALTKGLSTAYMELQGNTSQRGHEQYVQKLKEGIRFALDCLECMTVEELKSIL